MNVKKVVKKIAALGVGATMLGATIFGAAAADLSDFPKPLFIDSNGAFNGLFVVGASAAGSDVIGLNAITAAVQAAAVKKVATTTTTTSTVEVEGGVDLGSGSKEIYLGNEINDRRTTITDSDLSLLSADTFTKDDGTTVDYEQTILVGDALFEYGKDSSADIKDPVLMLQGTKNSQGTDEWYSYKVHFDESIDLNDDTNVTGQQIELFGKTYTIGTDSDNDELVLLGGATDTTLQVGETQEVDFNGDKVTLEVLGIGSSTVASIKVNGVFKEVTEGHTYTIGGQDVYVKTVAEFSGTENAGLVTLQLGADKLWFKDGTYVKKGNDKTSIYGTHVSMSISSGALTELIVYVSADSTETKYLQEGDEATDDVFGAVKLQFADVNADLEDTDARKTIKLDKNGQNDMSAEFEVKGNAASVEFAHKSSDSSTTVSLADSDGYAIEVVEGAHISENEYFFLNYGDYQHMMKLNTINYDTSTYSDSEIEFEDVFTGTTYKVSSWDSTSATSLNATKVIDGATYYIKVTYNGGTPYVQFTVSSVSGESGATYGNSGDHIQIFQYLEPISGGNERIWFVDDSVAVNVTHENQTVYFVTPEGTSSAVTIDTSSVASGTLTVSGAQATYRYDYDNESNYFNFTMVVDSSYVANPAVMLREDDDESNTKNVVVLRTTTSGSGSDYYVAANSPLFSASTTYSSSYDDSDYNGYVDYYGTFVKTDGSDSDQKIATLWYPTEQMYAKFYIAPVDAGTTTSTSTSYSDQVVPIPSSASVLDSEVNDWTAQNMIVVGGPCVNSVAAALMGNPAECAAGFELGKAKIKLYDEADGMNAGKVALLVAGYSAEDTRRAATVLANYADYADQLKGTEVEVTGTSLTDITVSTPTTE